MKKVESKKANEEMQMYNPYCKIYHAEIDGAQEFDVYLTGEITSPDVYSDLLNILFSASPEDTIHIKVNSPGGDLDTGLQIEDAIRACRGTVIGYLSGSADSAASAIFVSCDQHVLGKLASMLVHTVSAGFFAPVHDMAERSHILLDQTYKWLNQTYEGFLTQEEITDIVVNKRQMWLDADAIAQRLERKYQVCAEQDEDDEDDGSFKLDFGQFMEDITYIKQWIAKQEASNAVPEQKEYLCKEVQPS